MKKFTLSVVAALSMSAFALAGGDIAPVEPEVVVPAPMMEDNWSGPYAGLQAGYIWGDADLHAEDNGGSTLDLNNFKLKGFAGGIHAGYNMLTSENWVLGLAGEANWMSVDDQKNIGPGGWDPDYDYKIKQKWETALLAKVGKVINDTYMPYIVGGATWTKIGGNFIYLPAPGTQPEWEDEKTDTVGGWTLGAGLEMKINENLHARLQYRYSDYDDAKLTHTDGVDYIWETIDYKTHIVQVGLSYFF